LRLPELGREGDPRYALLTVEVPGAFRPMAAAAAGKGPAA